MIGWATAAPAVTAAFLGSLVEVVETFTIVLAVGTVRGWRPALVGTAAGLALLAVVVLTLGPVLDRVPLQALQLAIGVLLLLFGLRWLRKAMLRSAGVIPLHDENVAFAKGSAALSASPGPRPGHLDWVAGLVAFKAVVLEGLEVVFIVIAVGARPGLLVPAGLGAVAACCLVVAAGLIIHKPLSKVPENTLKYGVGVMLSAFGMFWTGEGLGVDWPGHDLAVPVLAAAFLFVGLATTRLVRPPPTGNGT